MMRAGLAAFALLVACAASPAQAQRADCEKLTDAHAYNRCLAAAGPASHAGSGAAPRAGARASDSRSTSRRAARSRAAGRSDVTVRRLPNGRMRMEIPAKRRR